MGIVRHLSLSRAKVCEELGRHPFVLVELVDDEEAGHPIGDDEVALRMTLGGGILPEDVRETLELALISLEGLDGAEDVGGHG